MDTWELIARESVRHTIAAYNFGGDRGRLDELVGTFAPDGSLQIGDGEPVVGHEAILNALQSAIVLDPVPRFVHHHVTGVHFRSVTRDAIDVASYFEVVTDAGRDHWGRYRDRFVPVGDRWLLAHRQILTDAFAPGSSFRR